MMLNEGSVELRVDVREVQKENAELKKQIEQLTNEMAALRSIEKELLQAINESN